MTISLPFLISVHTQLPAAARRMEQAQNSSRPNGLLPFRACSILP
jgi:hypothetical protein